MVFFIWVVYNHLKNVPVQTAYNILVRSLILTYLFLGIILMQEYGSIAHKFDSRLRTSPGILSRFRCKSYTHTCKDVYINSIT